MAIKRILVISHRFPPHQGVGARRWAKFAKYFAREGVEVHVVHANWKPGGKVTWSRDVQGPGIVRHVVNDPFVSLANLLGAKNKWVQKLPPKVKDFRKYIDPEQFWGEKVMRKLSGMIRKVNPEVIVVTGAPFSLNYLAARYKEKHPEVKVVQDMRDTWTDGFFYNLAYSGQKPTPAEQAILKRNQEQERFMLEHSDAVVAVSSSMLDMLLEKAQARKPIGKVIYNGFDPEEKLKASEVPAREALDKTKLDPDCFNFSYFGSVGAGRQLQLKKFVESFPEVPEILDAGIRFNFFGSMDARVREFIEQGPYASLFRFNGFVPPAELQQYLYWSDVHTVINPDFFHFAFSTKFYDALMYEKPLLLMMPEGEVYDFVMQHGIGLGTDLSPEQNKALLKLMAQGGDAIRKALQAGADFDREAYAIPALARGYLKFFESLVK